jgi:DnaJ family protein C protein 19
MRPVRNVYRLKSSVGRARVVFAGPQAIEDPRKRRQDGLVLQHRDFRVSVRQENPLIVGGIAVVVASIGASYVINAYQARQAAQSDPSGDGDSAEGVTDTTADGDAKYESTNDQDTSVDEDDAHSRARTRQSRAKAREARAEARAKEREAAKKGGAAKGGFFDDFMTDMMTQMGYGKNAWTETKAGFFSRNFYDGGFEDKMTKREAALILGVRENTSVDRIKVQHRKILLINHPDRGGSPYVAAKINEAKDLLLKGKKG